MDDKEYYSIKRISSLSVEQLQNNLKKVKKIENKSFSNYREAAIFQGHDDAEMLLEKQNNFDSNFDSENNN